MRYFWAFVVAVVLFCLGGLFAVYEGYHKIHDPHELDSPAVAIGILAVAFVLESFALRTAIKHASPQRGNRSWREYITRVALAGAAGAAAGGLGRPDRPGVRAARRRPRA